MFISHLNELDMIVLSNWICSFVTNSIVMMVSNRMRSCLPTGMCSLESVRAFLSSIFVGEFRQNERFRWNMVGIPNRVHDTGSSHWFNQFANPFDERERWTTCPVIKLRVEITAANLLWLGRMHCLTIACEKLIVLDTLVKVEKFTSSKGFN